MKLAARYNRINLGVTLGVLLIASAAFYFLLHRILVHQLDEDLEIEMVRIQTYLAQHNRLPDDGLTVPDMMVRYERTTAPMEGERYRSLVMHDVAENHTNRFRQLSFPLHVGSAQYTTYVSKSQESTEATLRAILRVAAATVLLMLAISTLLNRTVLRRLWKPFYRTLEKVKDFQLGGEPLSLPPTRTDEFRLMNNTLETTTGKASQDYRLLKEFTENASHELQTPLSIIRSKLDLIIQDEALTDAQSAHVSGAYDAVQRLVHLNSSLLLLAKVEGGQFASVINIDVETALKEKLEAMSPHIAAAGLTVQSDLRSASWSANPALSDALLNNLLSNAIHHNREGGTIRGKLRQGRLTVINTGSPRPLSSEGLFTRFYKANAESTRTGLGLAIVRQICEVSGFEVAYRFENGTHRFSIAWTAEPSA